MSKRLKALIAGELENDFKGLDKCVIVGLTGIPAVKADEVRAGLADKNMRLRVVKNTLAAVALKQAGIGELADLLQGPSAVVVGGDDVVELVKAAADLTRQADGFSLLGGYGEGRVFSADEVEKLSKIPPRQELLAGLAGAMSSTLSNFAGVLGAVQRNFVYALGALKDQKS